MEKELGVYVLREKTKTVAYAVEFPEPDSTVVVCWDSDPAGTEIWLSMEKMMTVHGHGARELVPMQKFDLGSP